MLRKERIKEIVKALNRKILSISKRSIYITSLIFVSGMVFYFLILISVVEFDIDNKATRLLAAYVPIPAYISSDGIVEYFQYKDIKNSMAADGLSEDELESKIKMQVLKSLVLEKLIKKYSLLVKTDESDIPQIAGQLALDLEVNLVPINRIKKIKQLIDKQGDFVRVATKYGDDLGQITLDYRNSADVPYFDDVKDLELGEVSDMVFTADGYYIFKCFDKDSSSIALSYVFIKSNTLDSFIEEEVKDYRMISFVD